MFILSKKKLIDIPDPRWNVTKSECEDCNAVFTLKNSKMHRIDLHIKVRDIEATFVKANKHGEIIVHFKGLDKGYIIFPEFTLTPETAKRKLKTILTFS